MQKSIWNNTKTALKAISESIEQQSAQIEAALNQHFSEDLVLQAYDQVIGTYLPTVDGQSLEPIASLMKEKSTEFAREKLSMAVRVNSTSIQISKQIKAMIDTRYKWKHKSLSVCLIKLFFKPRNK